MRSLRFTSSLLAVVIGIAPALVGAAPRSQLPVNVPLCGVAGRAQTRPKTVIRVATFNVLHGLEETPQYPTHSTLDARLELAVQAIKRARIDLVGMQEVSNTVVADGGHISGLVAHRMASRLAAVTGAAWHWCWHASNPHFPVEPEVREGGGGLVSDFMASMADPDLYKSFYEGAAVLSRYPILMTEARRLPLRFPAEYVACPPDEIPGCNETAIFDHRIALWARVATPGGPTDIIATHLVHDITPLSDVSTFEQAAALIELSHEMAIRHGEAARYFITCDCNVTTEDTPPVVQLLESAGWTDTYPMLNPTSLCAPPADTSACTSDQDILAPRSTTTERIDYVFARPGTCDLGLVRSGKYANRPGRTRTHRYLWPSDHQAVWTDVGVAGC